VASTSRVGFPLTGIVAVVDDVGPRFMHIAGIERETFKGDSVGCAAARAQVLDRPSLASIECVGAHTTFRMGVEAQVA